MAVRIGPYFFLIERLEVFPIEPYGLVQVQNRGLRWLMSSYLLCVRVEILLLSTMFDQISKRGRVGDNKLNKNPIISAPLISLFLNIFPPSNNEMKENSC